MYYSYNIASINLTFVAVQEMSSLHSLATIKIIQFNGSIETYGKEPPSSGM